MSLQKVNIRTALLIAFVLLIGILRVMSAGNLLSPLANFTPIGAMALFGGTYFTSLRKSFLFPLLSLFLSDVVMMRLFYQAHSNGLLYQGWIWTYSAFAVMVIIGRYIKKVRVSTVLLGALSAAFAHWLITDYGVWLGGGLDIATGKPLTHNWQGFVQCYLQAIPFFKNMLLGNLVYGTVLYGGWEILQKQYPILHIQKA